MGSIKSISPAPESSIIAGQDLTIRINTSSDIWNLFCNINGTEYTACRNGEFYLEYGMEDYGNGSGNYNFSVFVSGSLLEDGENGISLSGEFFDDDTFNTEFALYGVSYGNCTPPSNVKINYSEAVYNATMTWKAGGEGTNNPVTGYVISVQESSDGTSWGEISFYKEDSGTSVPVEPPNTVGHYRRFGVQTKGKAGNDYLSTVVWSSSLKKVAQTKVGEPTNPKFDATLSREAVRFSWGAGSNANGGNNVTGYNVQYQDSTDGVTWPSEWINVNNTEYVTGTEVNVSPPSTVGHYRRVRVRTRGSISEEWHSSWVISANTLRRKWNAFPTWTDPTLVAKSSHIRAVHMTEMQERINFIRTFFGASAYSFTAVKAGETKIAKWAALICEMRAALDDFAGKQSNWNTLEAGKPRIAHITQLRSVIDNW